MKHLLSIAISIIIYVASGQNPMGDKVMAELVDHHQNGTVTGLVFYNSISIPVTGEWTGVGQAVLIDANGTPYQVEVIE